MRIVCAFMSEDQADEERRLREALLGHDVTVVYSYEDLRFVTAAPALFDVILTDLVLKWSLNSKEDYAAGAFISAFLPQTLVRGLGVFIPDFFETAFATECEHQYHSIVVSCDCATDWGGRDWVKLLGLVTARMKAIDDKVT
jgi:hypothetical protein